MNNFEKIKNMSIDELSVFICSNTPCEVCVCEFGHDNGEIEIYDCLFCNGDSVTKKWLKSEVEDE